MQSKEIHKAIRGRVSTKQITQKVSKPMPSPSQSRPQIRQQQRPDRNPRPQQRQYSNQVRGMDLFKQKFDELKGSKDACIIDKNLETLGQVPVADLASTIQGLGSKVYAIVINGKIPKDVVFKAERNRVNYLVGSGTEQSSNKVRIITLR